MATIARRPPNRPISPSVQEREEAPGYEALRQVLRVLFVVSLAATAVLAVFPVFGMLLLPAVFAIVCYVGLMAVSWLERRRWEAHHTAPGSHQEVGHRVVTGGQAGVDGFDTGDATSDHEARSGGIRPTRVAGAVVAAGATDEQDDLGTADMLTRPQRAGAKVFLKIGVILVVAAVVIGAVMFDWRLLGVGAVLVFSYMALVGMPVWLASVEDAAEASKAGGPRPRPR